MHLYPNTLIQRLHHLLVTLLHYSGNYLHDSHVLRFPDLNGSETQAMGKRNESVTTPGRNL